MSNRSFPSRSLRRQLGFTLVELMVGLLLGMLTVLLISEVLAYAENKKRATSMGSDAQVNGALALHTLKSDIQMAGYGASVSQEALGCQVKAQFDASSTAFEFTLTPVEITDGADGAPDSITVLQGRTSNVSVPMVLTEAHPKTTEYFKVESSLGVVASNMLIAVPVTQDASNWCALFAATNDTGAAATTLNATNVPHVSGTAKWNLSSSFPDTYPAKSYLLNMGSMVRRTYSIDSKNNLQAAELSPTTGAVSSQELYSQIVNLQAMYGKDTNNDGLVDTYDNTTPSTAAQWQQVLAIRVAVVARSNQYEKEVVTSSAPLWDVGAASTITGPTTKDCPNAGSPARQCISLDVSRLADWDHYRYKVYDTVIPLRNMLWNS